MNLDKVAGGFIGLVVLLGLVFVIFKDQPFVEVIIGSLFVLSGVAFQVGVMIQGAGERR